MKLRFPIALACASLFLATAAFAQSPVPTYPLQTNQTEGYAKNQVVAFTYNQNYACVVDPNADTNHNGKTASVEPSEFNPSVATVGQLSGQAYSHCLLGYQPTIDPSGAPIAKTAKLYVLVPFFGTDTNPNDAFTPELGSTLISLFGTVPEAFRTLPSVPVQCPEPGLPRTKHKGEPGTCTMHTTTLDFASILDATVGLPAGTAVPLQTPNHSHIIDSTNNPQIWWQVVSVLVTDPSAWPNADGTSGITSVVSLEAAQNAHKASADIPTNFFLFFGSHHMGH